MLETYNRAKELEKEIEEMKDDIKKFEDLKTTTMKIVLSTAVSVANGEVRYNPLFEIDSTNADEIYLKELKIKQKKLKELNDEFHSIIEKLK